MVDGDEVVDASARTSHDTGSAVDNEATQAAEAAENVVQHDIEALLAERDSFRDIAQRLQADFENYRKRVAAQTADEVERATGRLAEGLLPVLDACEAAFVAHPTEIEPIFNLLLSEMKKLGLEGMNIAGTPFDPHLAEAVMREDGEGDENGNAVVVDVMRSGYTWKGKVLRPALVKVRG